MAQLAPLSPRSSGESLPSSPRGVVEVPLATPVNVREEQNRAQLLEEQRRTSKWADFVLPTELIVMTGTVNKKKGLFAKRRQLILTDIPRLVYVDDDKVGAASGMERCRMHCAHDGPVDRAQRASRAQNMVKGEIPLTANTRLEQKNAKVFLVHAVRWSRRDQLGLSLAPLTRAALSPVKQ